MGNRATVIFTDKNEKSISPAVYLHWNGGAESVYAFLDELDRRNARNDQDYECARFIQLIGDFFDMDDIGSASLGVVNAPNAINIKELKKVHTDHGDNGFYIVSRIFADNKMTVRMRRFVEGDHTLVELTPEEVAQEKENAYRHSYNLKVKPEDKTIAEHFIEIQGKRKISKY